ncbi:MAG: YicC/YloC family endoribonuclease [Azospirillaceae bacterium]
MTARQTPAPEPASEPAPAADSDAGAGLVSMTGFARDTGEAAGFTWVWEARSVNGKQLDVRPRLPSGMERLEPTVRAEAQARFKRGNVSLGLSLGRAEAVPRLRLNREVVDQVMALAREIEGIGAAPPRLDSLLSVRGVIESVDTLDETDQEALDAAILASLGRALDALARARLEEGARLAGVLGGAIDRIEALVADARASAEAQPEALRERLRQQVAEILEARAGLPEDRLAQEVAVLVAKADVREELDRLDAHIEQARGLLTEGGPVGRRLDFLCQEFNREANTLCSKAAEVALTRVGLDLKAVIDQFREQIQNIE